MYVLPAERRRYLPGTVDEEFERFLAAVRVAYEDSLPDARVSVVTEKPGEVDLRGDATWRALERLYSRTGRRWGEVRCGGPIPPPPRLWRPSRSFSPPPPPLGFSAPPGL